MIDKNYARSSSYDAYYKPAMNRTNLHVLTYALIQQVLFTEGDRAEEPTTTGVIFSWQSTGLILSIM